MMVTSKTLTPRKRIITNKVKNNNNLSIKAFNHKLRLFLFIKYTNTNYKIS